MGTTNFGVRSVGGSRIVALESIRGLAATLVVLFHIPGWNPELYGVNLIRNSYLMVELFFVLSGYVIFSAYSSRITSGQALLRFQLLRFGRLYPVHFLYLIIFLVIELLEFLAKSRVGVMKPSGVPFQHNSGWAFAQQVFLFQDIGPTGNAFTFNVPAWSISVEFYTYFIFAAVVLWTSRLKLHVFALIATVSICLLITDQTWGFTDFLRCTSGFFVGCITAALAATNKRDLKFASSGAVILTLLAFLQWKPYARWDQVVYVLSSALVLCLSANSKSWTQWLLNSKPLVWIGTISYSLYMSHFLVLVIENQVFRSVLKRPELVIGERSTPQLSLPTAIAAYSVTLPLIFLIGYLTYRYIEAPFRERSRRATLWMKP